jgi:hypothetical protein
MKIIYETGDMVMFQKASDGQGHEVWGKARVTAVVGDSVHLDNDVVVTEEKLLPSLKDVYELDQKVTTALNSAREVKGVYRKSVA